MRKVQLLYTAAHGGFAGEGAPLGGGAAIFELLTAAWRAQPPGFAVTPLTPNLLGPNSPTGRGLTAFNESQYADFCRRFSAACTQQILQHPPASTIVLANDISEGPSFAELAAKGYPIFTIFHVDVVAYIAATYCKGLLKPQTLIRWYDRLGHLGPRMLQLIFEQQRQCVEHSQLCLLPSQQMRNILQACYPHVPASRFHVVPWGAPPLSGPLPAKADARVRFGLPQDATVLLLLSRLSREKNQQLLLDALRRWEGQGTCPANLHVLLCGEAAFMHGESHAAMLRLAAAKLRQVKVHFAGHVTGEAKLAALAAADLYVFPSSHESYGLTLMEAFSAGLPALTLDHAGARSVMRPEFGAISSAEDFLPSLQRLLADLPQLPLLGRAAQAFARSQPFSQTASSLAELLLQHLPNRPSQST